MTGSQVKTVCSKCSKEFRNCGFALHFPACKGPKPPKKIRGVDYDPNGGYKTGRIAWNKGLTKEDPRILAMAQKLSKSLKGRKGVKINWSKEGLLKLSKLQSERLTVGYATGKRKQVGGYVKWYEVDGVKVQGTWEVRAAKIFAALKSKGLIQKWEHGKSRVQYIDETGSTRTYTIDFTITRNDGTIYVVEVKGRKTPKDDLKWEAARKQFEFQVWDLSIIKNFESQL